MDKSRAAMKENPSIFISYTHKDKDRITPLASYLGRLGLKVWMDTQDLVAGQAIIEVISGAIEKADLYVVGLSPEALQSQWVLHELHTALTLETTRGRPKVLPVLLVPTPLPSTLAGRLYIDLTHSLDEARPKIRQSIATYLGTETAEEAIGASKDRQIVISSVRLALVDETTKCYGGLTHDHDKEDVQQEATELLRILRRRANGILLNSISAA
jgi:RecG-like helicase